MSERCHRCDRADCPWPEAYRVFCENYQHPVKGQQEAEQAADADCKAHKVNWRDEALRARSEIKRLRALLADALVTVEDVYRRYGEEFVGDIAAMRAALRGEPSSPQGNNDAP